jgi:hypothetical protein
MRSLFPSTIAEAIAAEQLNADLQVRVIGTTPPIPIPQWLYEDLGLEPPTPEPTPQEKALAILAPHLAWEPLYQP